MIIFTSKIKIHIELGQGRFNLSKILFDSSTNIASAIIFNIVSLLNIHDIFLNVAFANC